MKIGKRIVLMLCIVVLMAAQPSAQQKTYPPSPDGFKALLLDETTLEQALEALGVPESDKLDKLDVSKIEKWLHPKHKEKSFRQLTYKKSPDFYKIELSFLDEKLVMIDLEFKKDFDPLRLRNIFAVNFAWLGGPASLPDKPGQYPIAFFPTHFPGFYAMVGISSKTFIFVNCASSGGGTSPGRVERTRQISRVLEKQ